MIRIASLVFYLAATIVAIILVNADWANQQQAVALWGLASIVLGLGIGRPSWALLAFLAVPFAVPFGLTNENLGSDAPPVVWFAFYWGIASALLIGGSAVIRMVVQDERRASAER